MKIARQVSFDEVKVILEDQKLAQRILKGDDITMKDHNWDLPLMETAEHTAKSWDEKLTNPKKHFGLGDGQAKVADEEASIQRTLDGTATLVDGVRTQVKGYSHSA